MQPISPQVPGYEDREIVIAKDQPEFIPLPALPLETTDGKAVLMRWTFTDEERTLIASGADLFVQVLTFGGPLQPIKMAVSVLEWLEPDDEAESGERSVGIFQNLREPS